MKRIDYYWSRAALHVTSIVFASQFVVESFGMRKVGYEWVLPVCGILFAASVVWAVFAVIWNVTRGRQ
jgi:hypothetical protein